MVLAYHLDLYWRAQKVTQNSTRAQMRELRAVWAQAARVEAMRAARRAAEAEADDEATDDEAEAAAVEDELLLGCI